MKFTHSDLYNMNKFSLSDFAEFKCEIELVSEHIYSLQSKIEELTLPNCHCDNSDITKEDELMILEIYKYQKDLARMKEIRSSLRSLCGCILSYHMNNVFQSKKHYNTPDFQTPYTSEDETVDLMNSLLQFIDDNRNFYINYTSN